MNNKSILKNIGISVIAKSVGMVIMYIYTPMALSFLGNDKYGAWAIILNVISWINYFDIGIGNGLKNKLAESFAQEKRDVSQELVSTAYLATFVISVLFCTLIVSIWNFFELSDFFNLHIEDESIDLIITVSISFVCINFVLMLSKTILYAVQEPGITSVIAVVGQALQLLTLFIVSYFIKGSLIVLAVIYGGVSLIDNLILEGYVAHRYPYLIPRIEKIKIRYLKPLASLGIGFFLMQICTLILNTTDNLLISNLFGVGEVTPYDMVYRTFYLFVQAHGIIIMSMWPAYTAAIAREDISWTRKTLKKVNVVTVIFAMGVIVGIGLFEPFAAIWLGKKLIYGRKLIIMVAFYMILQMFSNNYSSFLCGAGEIKVSSILSLIGAIMNIPLSIFFSKKMGISGVIFGSLIVMLMNVIVLPIITERWFKEYTRDKNE